MYMKIVHLTSAPKLNLSLYQTLICLLFMGLPCYSYRMYALYMISEYRDLGPVSHVIDFFGIKFQDYKNGNPRLYGVYFLTPAVYL